MSHEARSYSPRSDSLAARVIAFFRRSDEDDELHQSDIALKFEVPREHVHASLKEAVNQGILKRNNTLYSAGPQLNACLIAAPAPAASNTEKRAYKTRSGYASPRKHIDFDSLSVDDNVPFVPRAVLNGNKYDPLFAKLAVVGQSIAVPGDIKGALAAAAIKRNKIQMGTFRVAMTSADEARIWRVA